MIIYMANSIKSLHIKVSQDLQVLIRKFYCDLFHDYALFTEWQHETESSILDFSGQEQ